MGTWVMCFFPFGVMCMNSIADLAQKCHLETFSLEGFAGKAAVA